MTLQPKDPPPVPFTSTRAADLLAAGKPFIEFPQHSILNLRQLDRPTRTPNSVSRPTASTYHGTLSKAASDNLASFSDWLSKTLQAGQPFVIRDFEKLPEWDNKLFSIESLIELSTKKNIPIRNCNTGRDLSFTLSKFSNAAHQSHKEFKNLYARDLQCPEAWLKQCRTLLPQEVQWGGRLDLFQWLPACARSEVMMAYVGSEGSSSGFHRCFSSTVALNLLVGSDRPALCFGTDFESQVKYDAFMATRGASPHVDWLNIKPEELQNVDFPVYVYDQQPGDLVVFPPATAHQVWNSGSISTKMVWNILHPLSLEAGLNYVQPPFNRLCHPDVARTNLSLACAMLSLLRDKVQVPPNLELLTRLFRQMCHDEMFDDQPATPMSAVSIPETAIATCNFCGTAIWNRHLQCRECQDFDLCLLCFLNGRSCEHIASYQWAEIVPQETCIRVLQRAEMLLDCKPSYKPSGGRQHSLGTAVNDLIRAKRSTNTKLCHLCRIDHLEWKGRRCDTCSAFFCYRGLYRHFDMSSADIMRCKGQWTCPKCLEICNCRCCHFPSAYVKAEKPASKRRVKPVDPRGKNMGFTDNVFDQKKRTTPVTSASGYGTPGPTKATKRPLPPPSSSTAGSESPHPMGPSCPNAPMLTPSSDSSSTRVLGREEDLHEPNKIRKILESEAVGNNSNQHKSNVTEPTDKTLHGIDYIAHMPSPSDEQVSLPPLKSGYVAHDAFPPAAGTSRLQPHPLSSTSEPAGTGFAEKNKSSVASSHPYKTGQATPTCNGVVSVPREMETDITGTSGTATMMSTKPPPRPSLTSQEPPIPTQQLPPRPTSPTTNPITHAHISQQRPPPPAPQQKQQQQQDQPAPGPPTPTPSIPLLTSRLTRLKHYAAELSSLSLHDSHTLLEEEIQRQENALTQLLAKRERTQRLVRGMEEEFPELGDVCREVRREGGELGYF